MWEDVLNNISQYIVILAPSLVAVLSIITATVKGIKNVKQNTVENTKKLSSYSKILDSNTSNLALQNNKLENVVKENANINTNLANQNEKLDMVLDKLNKQELENEALREELGKTRNELAALKNQNTKQRAIRKADKWGK